MPEISVHTSANLKARGQRRTWHQQCPHHCFRKRSSEKLPWTGKFVLQAVTIRERKKHKHKQICGIVPGLGGWQNFVYVFFSGHSLWGEKHTNKISPKILGQSRKNSVYVFLSYVFLAPKTNVHLSSNISALLEPSWGSWLPTFIHLVRKP